MVDAQEQIISRVEENEILPKKTKIGVFDIDQTFLSRAKHFAEIVLSKVEIHNRITKYAAEQTKTSYLPTFLTTRPAEVFLSDNNDSSPVRFLRNVMGTIFRDGKAEEEQIRAIVCENGMVWLVRRGEDKDERNKGGRAWNIEINNEYEEYRSGPRKLLEEIIKKTFIETNRYKIEEGTLVLLNLQHLDETHIAASEKADIVNELEEAIKAAGHEELLDEIYMDKSQNDVDIYPRKEFHDRKRTGIEELVPLLKSLGYGRLNFSDLVYIDDSIGPANKASQLVAALGGVVGSPANAQGMLKRLVEISGGVVSEYDTFWGTMSVLYETMTGVRPTVQFLEAKELLKYDKKQHLLITLGRKANLLCKDIIKTSGYDKKNISTTNFINLNYGIEQIVKCITLEPDKYVGSQFLISVQDSSEELLLTEMWKKISVLYQDYNPGFSIVILNRNNNSSKKLDKYSSVDIDRITRQSGNDHNSCRVSYNNANKRDAISLAMTITQGFLQSGVLRKKK